ncbi:hypothetical protein Cgig2_032752 [Carnegiea gigantea]|uniref:COX assembly mitochondrial protein 2 homolog n=1 Tax=Carnegiea gigantea TaxID=171969 RepID=A0A9Q1KJF0_9CARY|nr:hypothetical protein Cgig2_032752 [Carnegiea gigantea]
MYVLMITTHHPTTTIIITTTTTAIVPSTSLGPGLSLCRILGQVGPGQGEVMLELGHPPIEVRNRAEAAMNRVTEAGLGFIGERVDGVLTVLLRDLVEKLANVAGPKHLVDLGELLGLVGPKPEDRTSSLRFEFKKKFQTSESKSLGDFDAASVSTGQVTAIISEKIIEEFQKCHAEHPLGKFFGECTELKIKLDRCFRQEKAIKRKANFEQSKKLREALQAQRKEEAAQ